jgi:hypothetical protein
MMRIRNTHSARARVVRKCGIGKSRVLRAVTLAGVMFGVLELTARRIDPAWRDAKYNFNERELAAGRATIKSESRDSPER